MHQRVFATGTVHLRGHMDVPEGRWAAVNAALPAHIKLTRAEEGCLTFDVEPCPQTPNRLLVSEVFADQDAFENHQERTRGSDWAQITAGIPRSYSVAVQE